MPNADLLRRHLTSLSSEAAALAQTVVDASLERLRASGAGMERKDDEATPGRPLQSLLGARDELCDGLAKALRAEFEQALAAADAGGAAPAARPARPQLPPIEELSLVDEAQAEREIEISRISQQVELSAESELRDLRALTAALVDGPVTLALAEAARPAAYAKAVSRATDLLGLSLPSRAAWMAQLGPPLAIGLRQAYAQSAEQLRGWGVEPQAYRVTGTPAAGARQAGAGGRAEPGLNELGSTDAPATLLPRGAAAAAPEQQRSLLNQLFEQIMADPRLEPAVKQAIDRLQVSVMRLALAEPGMLSSAEHPTWSLIDQIAAHASDHPSDRDVRGTDFMAFVEPLIEQLSRSAAPEAFARASEEVRRYISREQDEVLRESMPAVQALAQAEQRQQLLPLLRQQVLGQLKAAGEIDPLLRRFLLEDWLQTMAHAMVDLGDKAPLTIALIDTVDELLDSLRPAADSREREARRQRLPALIGHLRQGMALVDLPQPRQDEVLDALMQVHRQQLLEQRPAAPVAPATPAPPPAPAAPAAAPAAARLPIDEEHADLFDDLVAPEVAADAWGMDTGIGGLPTVPMDLSEHADQAQAPHWLAGLEKGTRFKLFLQGQWTTAVMLWHSDNGGFYMFSSPLASRSHSMTRRALDRLRAEGLATVVAEPSLVQRAVFGMRHGGSASG